jgi:hypothetical protein
MIYDSVKLSNIQLRCSDMGELDPTRTLIGNGPQGLLARQVILCHDLFLVLSFDCLLSEVGYWIMNLEREPCSEVIGWGSCQLMWRFMRGVSNSRRVALER